ncbi:uncharacterized protein LOC111050382 [Nilaparvata lugens]|uniref:uncharacterized protein LOC111050382 n=1 Tax=Nilaparvata lugens TaxID=108931 RepID=UPI00193EBCFC|nr:uncharacterized protein LOC111050382 [Nilaparvata lugens]
MEDWMTIEEKAIIIPHIMGATAHTEQQLDMKSVRYEDPSEIISNKEKLTQVKKPKFTFETGSTYEGEWDAFGMSGKGVFKMFNVL